MEAAKATKAKVQIDEKYMTEEEEERGLLKLMEDGNKDGRLTEGEQADFRSWLTNRLLSGRGCRSFVGHPEPEGHL